MLDTMDKDFDRIHANNPWWDSVRLIEDDSLLTEFNDQKYRYHHPLLSSLDLTKDGVITIRGPRRVGKSTLFRLLIKKLLLDIKLPKEAVFFFPCDRVKDYNDLFDVTKTYLDYARPRTTSRLYLFLDEISFVTDWQKAIKEMVDNGMLKNALVLLTGSSILDLKYGSEFLSGRRGAFSPADIFYHPLSFKQFVEFVSPQTLADPSPTVLYRQLPTLQKLFGDFLLTGGFPKTINEFYTTGQITNSTYDTFITWTENDLHKTRKSEQIAYDLLATVFKTVTTPISYISLARDSSLASHLAVQDYLDIMEKMFVLFTLNAYVVEEKRRDSKKNKKIYFTDPFIFNSLYLKVHELMENPFAQSQKLKEKLLPAIAENCVGAKLVRDVPSMYWGKTATGEVDFVTKKEGKLGFYEVKYRKRIPYDEVANLPEITVVSADTLTDAPVKTVPLEIFLLS